MSADPPGADFDERQAALVDAPNSVTEANDDELPIVARMVVEIRSDGTRTIARGALEDVATGQKVAVETRGGSPMQLALSMAKSMFAVPVLARRSLRSLLPGFRSTKRIKKR